MLYKVIYWQWYLNKLYRNNIIRVYSSIIVKKELFVSKIIIRKKPQLKSLQ